MPSGAASYYFVPVIPLVDGGLRPCGDRSASAARPEAHASALPSAVWRRGVPSTFVGQVEHGHPKISGAGAEAGDADPSAPWPGARCAGAAESRQYLPGAGAAGVQRRLIDHRSGGCSTAGRLFAAAGRRARERMGAPAVPGCSACRVIATAAEQKRSPPRDRLWARRRRMAPGLAAVRLRSAGAP